MKKAWQRQIRDKMAKKEPREIATLDGAEVREITYAEAASVILKYEWLGNMGTTGKAYGLFIKEELAGVVCFGRTNGTNVVSSVAGEKWKDNVIILCRGACVHWAPPHAASFLINKACNSMAQPEGWIDSEGNTRPPANIVVAYSDSDAGEIGTVYQASNWLYCLQTATSTVGKKKGQHKAKAKDMMSLIRLKVRDRSGRKGPDGEGKYYFERGGKKYFLGDTLPDGKPVVGKGPYIYIQKMTRAEAIKALEKEGYIFTSGNAKHRYVGIFGDKRTRRAIRKDLKWPVGEYPKRADDSQGKPLAPPAVG